MTTYVIYKHTCVITGKSYIGFTSDIARRTREHRRSGGSRSIFRNAIQKYGWENFTTEILVESDSREETLQREITLIAEHNTQAPRGYNITTGGECPNHTDESKKKMSAAKLGIPKSEKEKHRIAAMNRARAHPMSTEHKIKLQSDEVASKRKAACAAYYEKKRAEKCS